MATRKRATKLVQAANGIPHEPRTGMPPIDPDRPAGSLLDAPSDTTPIAPGEQDSLMDILAGFIDATAVTVKVYRAVKNKPLAYMYECSPETFSLDSLRDDHGGGEFRVMIYNGGQLIKNVRTMIEPPRQPVTRPSEIDATLATMREAIAKQGEVLTALVQRAANPPAAPSLGDTLARMDLPAVIGAVGSLLTLMRPPPAPPAPPPPPAADPMAGIEMFMKAFELARELQGDGGGEKNFLGVISDLVKSPLLAQAVAAGAQTQQMLPPPQQVQPRPMLPTHGRPAAAPMVPGGPPVRFTPSGPVVQQPMPAAAPVQEVSHAKLPEQIMPTVDTSGSSIAGYMEWLTQQAIDGADPELYGGLILDQVDDTTIISMLNMPPDPVSYLISLYPPAEGQREWFEQVVAYVAEAYEEGIPDPVAAGAGVTVATGVQSEGQSPDAGDGDAAGHSSTLSAGGPSAG